MKQWLYISIPLAFLLFSIVFSLDEVIKAFKSGNVGKISPYLDQSVEITFHDQKKTYSRIEVQAFLKSFFNGHKVADFKVLHQSESDGSAYCIGELITSNGHFRTTIYVKDKAGKTLIQEIRLEN